MSGLNRTADALLTQKAAQTAAHEELQTTFGHNSRKIRSLMVSMSMIHDDISRLNAQREASLIADQRITRRLQEVKDRNVAQTHVTNQSTEATVAISKASKEVGAVVATIVPAICRSIGTVAAHIAIGNVQIQLDDACCQLETILGELHDLVSLRQASGFLFEDASFDVMACFDEWHKCYAAQHEEGKQRIVANLPGIKKMKSVSVALESAVHDAQAQVKDVEDEIGFAEAAYADKCTRRDELLAQVQQREAALLSLRQSKTDKIHTNAQSRANNETLRVTLDEKRATLDAGASALTLKIEQLKKRGSIAEEGFEEAQSHHHEATSQHAAVEAEKRALEDKINEVVGAKSVWCRRQAQNRRLRTLRYQETDKQRLIAVEAITTLIAHVKARCGAEEESRQAQAALTDAKSKIEHLIKFLKERETADRQLVAQFIDEESVLRGAIELEFTEEANFNKLWFDKIADEVILCHLREYHTMTSLEELNFLTIVESHHAELDAIISRAAARQAAQEATAHRAAHEAALHKRAIASQEQSSRSAVLLSTAARQPRMMFKTVQKVDLGDDSDDGGVSIDRLLPSEDRRDIEAQVAMIVTTGTSPTSGPKFPSQRQSLLLGANGQGSQRYAPTLPTTPTASNQRAVINHHTEVTTPITQQRIRATFLPPVPKFSTNDGHHQQQPSSLTAGGNVGRTPVHNGSVTNSLLVPRRAKPTTAALTLQQFPSEARSDSMSSVLGVPSRKAAPIHISNATMNFEVDDNESMLLQLLDSSAATPQSAIKPPPGSNKGATHTPGHQPSHPLLHSLRPETLRKL